MTETATESATRLREAVSSALTAVIAAWDERDVPATKTAGFPLGDFTDAMLDVFESEAAAQYGADIAGQTKLRELAYRDGTLHMELDAATGIIFALVASARTILGNAENYVEMELKAAESLDRFVLTIQRAGKLTPHKARLNAEAERDALRAQLHRARACRLAKPFEAVDPAVHTPARVYAYLSARGWQQRPKQYGFWDLGNDETVFVHRVATASDYAGRTGLLVSDLAAIYGTGELQVLADIAEAGNGE